MLLDGHVLDLDKTFSSGQCFTAEKLHDGSYALNVQGIPARLTLTSTGIVLDCAPQSEAFFLNYLDMQSDYTSLLLPVLDAPLRAAMDAQRGLRLLNQPFFETLCAFILSSNNNMGRITNIMRKLRTITPIDENGIHPFPTATQIVDAGSGFIDSIGAGYRANYIWKAATCVAQGYDWDALRLLSYESASNELRTFAGVGEKVADCVLLFSLGHRCAFPVDVWVERLLTQWYGFSGTRSQLKRKAMERFGPYGGIAQQYLFYHATQDAMLRKREHNKDACTIKEGNT